MLGIFPWNTRKEPGIHTGWDAWQDMTGHYRHLHTQWHLRKLENQQEPHTHTWWEREKLHTELRNTIRVRMDREESSMIEIQLRSWASVYWVSVEFCVFSKFSSFLQSPQISIGINEWVCGVLWSTYFPSRVYFHFTFSVFPGIDSESECKGLEWIIICQLQCV